MERQWAMKTINTNLGLNFTPFERDIDQRVREYFDDYLPWGIEHYRSEEMQGLYGQWWAKQLEEQT
jgi:hypothetical protein